VTGSGNEPVGCIEGRQFADQLGSFQHQLDYSASYSWLS
jgi:hypothetical protein